MALVLDESFATGVPVGFATDNSQFASQITVAWNAAEQAVDLTSTVEGTGLWDITSVARSPQGMFEIDIELLEDYFAQKHAGIWAVIGVDSRSHAVRYSHYGATYDEYSLSGGSLWNYSASNYRGPVSDSAVTFNVGQRRTFKLRWDTVTPSSSRSEFSVDDIPLFIHANGITSIRPGVFVYRSKIRVHSVKVWDTLDVPLPSYSYRGMPSALGRLDNSPPEARTPFGPGGKGRGVPVSRRNAYFGGPGVLTGTVKEKNLPANSPLRRKVQLYDATTSILLRETWSDKLTGQYVFTELSRNVPYTVISYDHTGAYRAVIADKQEAV